MDDESAVAASLKPLTNTLTSAVRREELRCRLVLKGENSVLGMETAPLEALGRLCQIAKRDTGQSRRVANFLLAWHNAGENGGWDPTDLWNVDTAIAEDMLAVLKLARDSHRYPGDLGFEPEINAIWRLWRSERTP